MCQLVLWTQIFQYNPMNMSIQIESIYLAPKYPISYGAAITLSIIFPILLVVGACYGVHQWLLPKPIPGIPFNPGATRSLLGDLPAMLEDVKATGEIYVWCCKQLSRMNSPIGQVFVTPFGRPWVLLSHLDEAKEILAHRRRGDWDTSHFLSDGLASFGAFHGRLAMGPLYRANRKLTQELMGSRFLRDQAGPTAFRTGRELVRLLEAKARLAQGRPFCVKQELAYASLDVLGGFFFGATWAPTALAPQVDLLLDKMGSGGDAPHIWLGPLDQPVVFPKAHPGELTDAIYQTLDLVDRTFHAVMPKLQSWLWSKQAWYRRLFETKHRLVRDKVAIALRNMQSGQVQTGVEHMLKQEEGVALKEGRAPDFDNQNIRDEVSSHTQTHTLSPELGH